MDKSRACIATTIPDQPEPPPQVPNRRHRRAVAAMIRRAASKPPRPAVEPVKGEGDA